LYVAAGESVSNKIIAVVVALAVLASGQAPVVPPVTTAPQVPAAAKPVPMGNMNLENASLTAVVDQLAQRLKLNIIVDPSLKGVITLNTYGDTSNIDPRNLLELILRINNFGLIEDGDLYRVIPLKSVSHMPLHPEINQKNIPDDDQTILNLVFL
jgi:general secretion pathway protein D